MEEHAITLLGIQLSEEMRTRMAACLSAIKTLQTQFIHVDNVGQALHYLGQHRIVLLAYGAKQETQVTIEQAEYLSWHHLTRTLPLLCLNTIETKLISTLTQSRQAPFECLPNTISDSQLQKKLQYYLEQDNTQLRAKQIASLHEKVLTHTTQAILTLSREGFICMANPQASVLFDIPLKNLMQKNWFDLLALRDEAHTRWKTSDLYKTCLLGDSYTVACVAILKKDLSTSPMRYTAIPTLTNTGKLQNILILCNDLSEIEQLKLTINEYTNRDPITHLANHKQFTHLLTQATAKASRHKRILSILHIDLDHFNSINEYYGQTQGDNLLKAIAQRLTSELRKQDNIARIGGDSFGIILEDLQHEDDAAIIATKLIEKLNEPYQFHDKTLHVSPSIGISAFPSNSQTADELMHQANVAMQRAKFMGRNTFKFYSRDMVGYQLHERNIILLLKEAMQTTQLDLRVMQRFKGLGEPLPIFDVYSAWSHPKLGNLDPNTYVPLLEQTGATRLLDEWVITTVESAIINSSHTKLLGKNNVISIYFESSHLVDLQSYHPLISLANVAREHQITIELKINADSLLKTKHANKLLQTLKQYGVRLSLNKLRLDHNILDLLKLPMIDSVFIDRNLIHKIESSPAHQTLVKTLISLTHLQGKQIVAKAVETQAQYDWLNKQQVNQYFGFLFSQPYEFLLPETVQKIKSC